MPRNYNEGIIYKVTSPSGKIYIGQTVQSFYNRKSRHISVSNNKNSKAYNLPICRAIRQYKDLLIWEIIDYVLIDQLDKKEIFYIEYFNSYLNGYNCTPGGDFQPSKLPEVKEKIGVATRLRQLNTKQKESTKAIWSKNRTGSGNPMFGKNHTPEARLAISIAAKKRKGSKNPNSKLSDNDRESIISKHFEGKSNVSLAKEFHVTKTTIGNVIRAGEVNAT